METMARKVLVVDDSRTVRTFVARALSEAGYDTIQASDGREAVEVAGKYRPDLAVLDVQMPYLDGYGVCQEFQRMGAPYSEIPIVFLTSVDSNALELLGDELGAYLQKPVQVEQLLETVSRFLMPAERATVNSRDVSL